MDYNEINSYLSSLEIDTNNNDNKLVDKKKNLTGLERDMTLNSNPNQNIEIAEKMSHNSTKAIYGKRRDKQ